VLPVANYSLELRISGATPAVEEQTEEVWISFAKMEFHVEIIRRDSWLVGMGLKKNLIFNKAMFTFLPHSNVFN